MDNIAYRLFDPKAFIIRVNHYMEQYDAIRSTLIEHGIYSIERFPTRDPEQVEEMRDWKTFYKDGKVEISFTKHCNFKDLYLLVYMLKEHLDSIWAIKGTMKIVRIGTYMYERFDFKRALAYPLSPKCLLEVDPKLSTEFVIDNYFVKVQHRVEIDDQEFDEYEYEGYVEENEYEPYTPRVIDLNDKATFDAMTDGQLGDYDDFKGDIDDVKTWAGRD